MPCCCCRCCIVARKIACSWLLKINTFLHCPRAPRHHAAKNTCWCLYTLSLSTNFRWLLNVHTYVTAHLHRQNWYLCRTVAASRVQCIFQKFNHISSNLPCCANVASVFRSWSLLPCIRIQQGLMCLNRTYQHDLYACLRVHSICYWWSCCCTVHANDCEEGLFDVSDCSRSTAFFFCCCLNICLFIDLLEYYVYPSFLVHSRSGWWLSGTELMACWKGHHF